MTAAVSASNTVRAVAANASRIPSALHFPIRKAISRRLWKVWGVGFTGMLVGAAILAAGYFDEVRAQAFGPGFHSLFNISAGGAIRYFGSVQIFLAGQLALFVWWARSRGTKESPFRYRTWAWLAAACFLASFAIAVEAHTAVNETIAWAMGENQSFRPELGWMVPAGCCALFFLWMLNADLRQSGVGIVMMGLAVVAWVSGGAINRVVDVSLDPLSVSLIQVGAVMFGHWCLLMSLVLHARHVAYGRVEKRHSEVVSKRTNPKKSAASAPSVKLPSKPGVQQRIDKSNSKPKPTEVTKQVAAVKGGNAALATGTDLREERAKSVVIDKGLLKGLSKRERRAVRKQFREHQRELHGEDEY